MQITNSQFFIFSNVTISQNILNSSYGFEFYLFYLNFFVTDALQINYNSFGFLEYFELFNMTGKLYL